METVCDPSSIEADAVFAAVDELCRFEVDPHDPDGVIAGYERLERAARVLDAARADYLHAVQSSGAYRADGHRSAKTQAAHVLKLSGGTAATRQKSARMCAALPEVARAWRRGELGTDHVNLLGRIHSNPRVRGFMADAEDWFLAQARDCDSYDDFRHVVERWAWLVDQDGPTPNDRNHRNRDFFLRQKATDLSWDISGGLASLPGAAINEIFEHYVTAELLADWDLARAEFGDAACEQHLARTSAQRRADALQRVFTDAVGNDASPVPADFTHNIVWDDATFTEMARRFDGEAPRPLDADSMICATGDGVPLDPTEAFANSLLGHIRRVVVDAAGVVIDLGQRSRCFTGSARQAAMLSRRRCCWPGCHVPASRCQVDHMVPHSRGGPTDQTNAELLCPRHNGLKEAGGYRVHRGPDGTIHTYRPDGTPIP